MSVVSSNFHFLQVTGFVTTMVFFPFLGMNAAEPDFRVAFGPGLTRFSGKVDSETTAEALVAAMKTARPDLPPDRSALVIDPAIGPVALSDLKSLLAEIALSTHEGRLELWPDHLVIGGLTDSIVTQSALRIRAEPFLKNRILHNRLCIVGTDDLPEIAVSLADGSKVEMEAAPTPVAPVAQTPFEAPGPRLEKLLATLALLADPSPLGAPAPAAVPAFPATTGPIRAEPLAMAAPTTNPTNTSGAATAPVGLTATPVETLEAMPPVYFSANSFLLQANQNGTLDTIAKQLLSPTRAGATTRVEALKPSGGSSTFNDYLCERRAAEVSRLLGERGVNVSLLRLSTLASRSPIDSGEVRITIVVPPPPPAPDPNAPPSTGGATPAPAQPSPIAVP